MEKTVFVENLRPGDSVTDFFAVADKIVSHKKDGAPFLRLVLTDRTGSVKGVAWDGVEAMLPAFDSGDIVRVVAKAGTYQDQVQLTIRDIDRAQEREVNPGDFLPACPTDPAKLFSALKKLAATITTPCLSQLMEAFWQDEDFVRIFLRAPAGKKMHHAYVGGLVEHTLSVALLVDPLAGHYVKNHGVDRDLLLAGAVLHDIGKVDDYVCRSVIDFSDSGRLVGHILSGVRRLDEKIGQIPDFPEETAMLLRHLIASHHGEREFGAVELPKTIEAVILNNIDDLDAKVNGIRNFMERDEHAGQTWSSYHRLMERHFYLGKKESAGG